MEALNTLAQGIVLVVILAGLGVLLFRKPVPR